MKFKLDENFGTRTQQIFRTRGHDVMTVREQQLQGCADQKLYEICCVEYRCLVTLDLDFSDVLRFPPQLAHGIVVIRVPHNPSLPLLEQLINQFLKSLETMSVDKNSGLLKPDVFAFIRRKTEQICRNDITAHIASAGET
jgi:predicted nuclease of predicted toxin-antitoxin system